MPQECAAAPTTAPRAWWPTDLPAKTLAVTEGPEGSVLWVGVLRGEQYSVEHVLFSDKAAGSYLLDGWVSVPLLKNGTQWSAYVLHLAARTATVLDLAGTAHDIVVENDGYLRLTSNAIDVGANGALVVVGQASGSAQIELLPFEGGGQRGTSQGARKRWAKVSVRLNDSARPTVAGELAARPNVREQPAEGARLTEDVIANTLGFDDLGRVVIAQPRPYRTEILAVFGNAQANEV